MTISYVSSAFAEATSISSMPAHQAGDLLIMCAYRSTTATGATTPAGWSSIRFGGSGNSLTAAFKIATSSNESSGTWTNAELVSCAVWRDSANYLFPVASNLTASAGSTSISYAALTPLSSTIQWIVAFGGGALNNTATETAPTGMTNRGSLAGASVGELAVHDSNGNLTSWSTQTVTVTSEKWVTLVIELRDTGIAKPAPRFGRNAGRPSFQGAA